MAPASLRSPCVVSLRLSGDPGTMTQRCPRASTSWVSSVTSASVWRAERRLPPRAPLAPARAAAPLPTRPALHRQPSRPPRPILRWVATASRRWCRLGRVRIEVEQQQRDGQSRLPIDHRVVDLHHETHAAVLEPRRQVDLPQRMRAVQRLRERRVGPRIELRPREHLVIAAECHHVAPEVEPLGVDPHRPREPAGRVCQPHAEARRASEPRRHLRDHPCERDRRAPRAGPETPLPRDVHVSGGGLRVEKRGVERRQAFGHPAEHAAARPPEPWPAGRKSGDHISPGGRISGPERAARRRSRATRGRGARSWGERSVMRARERASWECMGSSCSHQPINTNDLSA